MHPCPPPRTPHSRLLGLTRPPRVFVAFSLPAAAWPAITTKATATRTARRGGGNGHAGTSVSATGNPWVAPAASIPLLALDMRPPSDARCGQGCWPRISLFGGPQAAREEGHCCSHRCSRGGSCLGVDRVHDATAQREGEQRTQGRPAHQHENGARDPGAAEEQGGPRQVDARTGR